jgi:hypothetical protein
MAAHYDIQAEKGSTFQLHMVYKDNSNTAVDLSSYSGRMQIRRSMISSSTLLDVTSGVTAGITGGTGGFSMNASATGAFLTGGILLTVDAVSMGLVPSGQHVYDLELVSGATISRLLEGRFECSNEVTR